MNLNISFLIFCISLSLMINNQVAAIINPPLGQPYGGNVVVAPCQSPAPPSQLWQTLLPEMAGPVLSAASLSPDGVQSCWDVETHDGGSMQGGGIQLYQCGNATTQTFTARQGFRIAATNGQVVGVAGAAGTAMQLTDASADATGAPQQVWEFFVQEDNTAQIFVRIGSQAWCATAQGLLSISKDHARTSPLVIGHRGTRTALPENTLPAFAYALGNLADGIESDLRLTADGEIVMLHDATLDRTTNCTGDVAGYTLAELQHCDACSWFDPDLHCTVPTFNQTLALIEGMAANGTAVQYAFLIMDLKIEGLAAPVKRSLSAFPDSQARVLASCWTETQVQDFGAVLPGVVHHRLSSTLPSGYMKQSFWTNEVLEGVRGYSIEYSNFFDNPDGPTFIKMAHVQMMSVVAWTLADEENTLKAIDYGCNGLICDSPLLCQQMVEKYRQNH